LSNYYTAFSTPSQTIIRYNLWHILWYLFYTLRVTVIHMPYAAVHTIIKGSVPVGNILLIAACIVDKQKNYSWLISMGNSSMRDVKVNCKLIIIYDFFFFCCYRALYELEKEIIILPSPQLLSICWIRRLEEARFIFF